MTAIAEAPAIEAAHGSSGLPFDSILEQARAGALAQALERLTGTLAEARRESTPEAWFRVIAEARGHPLRELLHRDPFTLRCYSKPRGYAADAPALDYVLRARELAVRSSDPVSALHHFMTHGETARALCFRRDAIAREVDKAAEGAALPLCVFAAGCGRLRECDRIRPSTPQRLGKLVAFDMDAENLAGLKRDYPELPILTHQGSVRQLVDGKHLFGDMDLVYCSGLMEALPQAAALGLSRALFAMLRPGGSLVITCFTHGLAEAGYLEAFMDWRMVYRTPVEIVDLAKAIASDEISGWTYRESPEATLGVLRVTRR